MGRALKMALKYKGLPVNFKELHAIAVDRSEWRSPMVSKSMPPSANWPCRIHGSKDEHGFLQKFT
jgi:hypothetical protein